MASASPFEEDEEAEDEPEKPKLQAKRCKWLRSLPGLDSQELREELPAPRAF